MTERDFPPEDDTREQVARAAAFFRRTLRFWRTPLIVLAIGAVACAVFLFFRAPLYRSEAVILYSEGVRTNDDADRPENTRSVTVRLKEILMSRASLDRVVREFNLYPDTVKKSGPVDAVEELRKHIEFRAPGGDTFSVAFTGNSPSQAQTVTSRLGSLVVDQDSDLRKKQATLLRDFLEGEKKTTDARLKDAETALASFMAEHPRFALDATPLATGAAIRASMGAAAAVGPAPAMGMRPRATGSGSAPAPGTRAPVNSDLAREAAAEETRASAELAAARANLADLTAHFTPAHPDVRAAQAEVERATNRLEAARAAGAVAAPAPPAPPPRIEEVALPRPIPQPPPAQSGATDPKASAPVVVASSKAHEDVVALETEWVKLTRTVTEARQHQDEVESALFKANTAVSSESGGQGVQVTMIDPAFLPQSPLPPGRAMIAALFAVGSLFIGLLAAVVRALADDRVYDARDLGRAVPVLVEVPRLASRRSHA